MWLAWTAVKMAAAQWQCPRTWQGPWGGRKPFFTLSNSAVHSSSFLVSRFVLSAASSYFPTCSLIFFPFDFFFQSVTVLIATKLCIYSHISPWIYHFLIAFTIFIPVPVISLSKLALKKKKFPFTSEFLCLILSETQWLILFLLLSPLVHITPMKGLSSKKLWE